jgi:hypothetical protein
MKAIIFSSAADAQAAALCRDYLSKKFGIAATINSTVPSQPRLPGLMGAETAREMCDAMISLAEGDEGVIARIDADTVFLRTGIEWLESAIPGSARSYFTGVRRTTCVSFSATRSHLAAARVLLGTAKGDGCSGCLICHALSRVGAMERARGIVVADDGNFRDPPADAHMVTLPSRALDSVRAEQLRVLWAGR